jgi:hypothetical protein
MGNLGFWGNFFGNFFKKIKSVGKCIKNMFVYVKIVFKFLLNARGVVYAAKQLGPTPKASERAAKPRVISVL